MVGYRGLEVSREPFNRAVTISRSASSRATDVTRGRSITLAEGCDHITVPDRGGIVEQGSHEEPSAFVGRYADVVGESLTSRGQR